MRPAEFLRRVDQLIDALAAGDPGVAAAQALLDLLAAHPELEDAALRSPSLSASGSLPPAASDTWASSPADRTWDSAAGAEEAGGTWVPGEGIGQTRGTWAAAAEGPAPGGLAGLCRALCEGSMGTEPALAALRAWRAVRGPAARYVIGVALGRGGAGDVMSATDLALDRELALKVLRSTDARARERFVAEAKLTARLDHPGVVPVHDVGETADGQPYFAMKQVRGQSLREALASGALGGLRARLDVFRRVCETVAFAHDRGVLHLDIKPDNVMVGAFGEVLVMDWGLARDVAPADGLRRGVAGTPQYMAPEQALPGSVLDVRADVYALGALLYELVCDRPAFVRGDVDTVLERVRIGDFPAPRRVRADIPRELEALVLHAMAHERAQRLPDVVTLLSEVSAFMEDRALATVPSTPWERLAKWRRRNRSLVRGAAVAGLVGLVALAVVTVAYVDRVQDARGEALRQAEQARRALADAQMSVAAALLDDGRSVKALAILGEARRGREALGDDLRTVDLALAEAAWQRGHVRRLPLPATPTELLVRGEQLFYATADGAGVLQLTDGALTVLPAPWTPVQVADDVWFFDRRPGQIALYSPTGALVRSFPIDGPASIWGGTVYDLSQPVAYDAQTGERVDVDWGPCARVTHVSGGYLRCAEGNERYVDPDTGAVLAYAMVMEASPARDAIFIGGSLRPQVVEPDGTLRWDADSGPALRRAAIQGGVAWLTRDGQLLSRSWGGNWLLRLDLSDIGCEGPVSVDPLTSRAFVGCDDGVVELRRAGIGLDEVMPHALALDQTGTVLAHAQHDQVVLTSGGRSRGVAIDEGARDMAFSDDGRLAVAGDGGSAFVIAPDGTLQRLSLGTRLLGVAWQGDVLLALDKQGEVIAWSPEGEQRTPMPGLDGSVWGIAPWAKGWVVSHWESEPTVAVRFEGGTEVARALWPRPSRAFDLAVSPDGSKVVLATAEGAMLWDGAGEPIALDDEYTVGVAWGAAGPIVATASEDLLFFDAEGVLLYRWDLGEVGVSLAYARGRLAMTTGHGLVDIPLVDADPDRPSPWSAWIEEAPTP